MLTRSKAFWKLPPVDRAKVWRDRFPLHLASGETLDRCGLWNRCPRLPGEKDAPYRERLLEAMNLKILKEVRAALEGR